MFRVKLSFKENIPIMDPLYRKCWFLVSSNMLIIADLTHAICNKFICPSARNNHYSLYIDGFSLLPDQVNLSFIFIDFVRHFFSQ